MLYAQPNIKSCIELCWSCRSICQEVLYHHCMRVGGRHIEQRHVRIMADCIQICQVSADFMTRGSDLHAAVCAATAEVCEACAESCDALDGEEMKHCADACRCCASACRGMAVAIPAFGLVPEREDNRPHVM